MAMMVVIDDLYGLRNKNGNVNISKTWSNAYLLKIAEILLGKRIKRYMKLPMSLTGKQSFWWTSEQNGEVAIGRQRIA